MADAKAIVEKLYRAFNDPGFLGLGGTDEEAALEALRTARDQGIMREVDALYAKTYPDEPNLKDEIDDELGGDDFDAAMKLYDEGMKAGPRAAPAAAANGAGKGGGTGKTPNPQLPIHGTLAPASPETLLVELLDDERKPVPGGQCRLAGKPGVFSADANGIVELPIPAGVSQIEIEWEEKDAAPDDGPDLPRYYWKKTLQLKVSGNDEPALSRQLSNLTFEGKDLKQQVIGYQRYYGKPETGNIADIRTELSQRIRDREQGGVQNA